jgi:hypothetical protein
MKRKLGALTVIACLLVSLVHAGDKKAPKSPFMFKAGIRVPDEWAKPRGNDLTNPDWRLGYIGCADSDLMPPDGTTDHRDSAFLLLGRSGTALYVDEGKAVSTVLDFRADVDMPSPSEDRIKCHVYMEKTGSRLWFFATLPAPKPSTPKYFSIGFADTKEKPPLVKPYTWALQTILEEPSAAAK